MYRSTFPVPGPTAPAGAAAVPAAVKSARWRRPIPPPDAARAGAAPAAQTEPSSEGGSLPLVPVVVVDPGPAVDLLPPGDPMFTVVDSFGSWINNIPFL